MIATSVKARGHLCFRDEWAGFDEFKPITVIIGRNNTGKSQLIDLVRFLCGSSLSNIPFQLCCSGPLTEEFLRRTFQQNRVSDQLLGDHWHNHGCYFLNQTVAWDVLNGGKEINARIPAGDPPASSDSDRIARIHRIQQVLPTAVCPISNKHFRWLSADRNVLPELEESGLQLDENGNGATNLIRRCINSTILPRDLIEIGLLKALAEIFGEDGQFDEIVVQHHDETEDATSTDRWEIFFREPTKGLIPLSKSGSGLKTVLLMLLNLLVVSEVVKKAEKSNMVFAFEELENNLHPALLRRVFKYLTEYVTRERCHLFLTTHSSVALDYFGSMKDAQIIHVSHDGTSAKTTTVAAHFDRVGLLAELGARPSDLLQANGVVWVEGPSDRLYVNRFIDLFSDGELVEGRDYQCAFYGGSLLARAEFVEPEAGDDELANLLRLNANIAVVCDGDRTKKDEVLKAHVERIRTEVTRIPGHFLWITEAKEIENYVPGAVWRAVFKVPSTVPDPTRFDRFPTDPGRAKTFVVKHLDRKSFDKFDFARIACPLLDRSALESRFDLNDRVRELVSRIRKWNK